MNVNTFLMESKRMCKAQEHCKTCPIKYGESSDCLFSTSTPECWVPEEIGRIVPIVKQWSAEHPRKTRLMDFRERYPDAPLFDGASYVVPRVLGYCGERGSCYECPQYGQPFGECWDMEVREDEAD